MFIIYYKIIGFLGKTLHSVYNKMLKRISGLDPAGK